MDSELLPWLALGACGLGLGVVVLWRLTHKTPRERLIKPRKPVPHVDRLSAPRPEKRPVTIPRERLEAEIVKLREAEGWVSMEDLRRTAPALSHGPARPSILALRAVGESGYDLFLQRTLAADARHASMPIAGVEFSSPDFACWKVLTKRLPTLAVGDGEEYDEKLFELHFGKRTIEEAGTDPVRYELVALDEHGTRMGEAISLEDGLSGLTDAAVAKLAAALYAGSAEETLLRMQLEKELALAADSLSAEVAFKSAAAVDTQTKVDTMTALLKELREATDKKAEMTAQSLAALRTRLQTMQLSLFTDHAFYDDELARIDEEIRAAKPKNAKSGESESLDRLEVSLERVFPIMYAQRANFHLTLAVALSRVLSGESYFEGLHVASVLLDASRDALDFPRVAAILSDVREKTFRLAALDARALDEKSLARLGVVKKRSESLIAMNAENERAVKDEAEVIQAALDQYLLHLGREKRFALKRSLKGELEGVVELL